MRTCVRSGSLVLIKLIPFIYSQHGLQDKEVNFLIEHGGWAGINVEYCMLLQGGTEQQQLTIVKRKERQTYRKISRDKEIERKLKMAQTLTWREQATLNFSQLTTWLKDQPTNIKFFLCFLIMLYLTVMFIL